MQVQMYTYRKKGGQKRGRKSAVFGGQKRVKNGPKTGRAPRGPGPGQKPLKSAKFSPFFDPLF